jgi:hypothetical protein
MLDDIMHYHNANSNSRRIFANFGNMIRFEFGFAKANSNFYVGIRIQRIFPSFSKLEIDEYSRIRIRIRIGRIFPHPCLLLLHTSLFMSDDRVISIRNRAVPVAQSLLLSSPSSATSPPMEGLPTFHDRDPTGPDPDVEARFTRLENTLQELLLRAPVERPKSPVAPVLDPRPPPPNEVDRGLHIVVRNRRFVNLLSVDRYRLRDTTPALRPAQVASLSSIAATIRLRSEGSFFSGTPRWEFSRF